MATEGLATANDADDGGGDDDDDDDDRCRYIASRISHPHPYALGSR